MSAGVDVDAAQAVAGLTAAIDALLALRLPCLPVSVLPELGRAVEAQLHRMATFDHTWIPEPDRRDAPGELGAKSVAAILVDTLRVTPGHARARVKAAADLGPRHGATGELLPPLFPPSSSPPKPPARSRPNTPRSSPTPPTPCPTPSKPTTPPPSRRRWSPRRMTSTPRPCVDWPSTHATTSTPTAPCPANTTSAG